MDYLRTGRVAITLMTVWRTVRVPGLENYEASTDGAIRNGKSKRELRQYQRRSGYTQVCLTTSSGKVTRSVHGLVASAFLDGWDRPGCTPDHINHVRSDNRLDNLRIATKQEQAANRRPFSKLHGRCVDVEQWTLDDPPSLVATYPSTLIACAAIGKRSHAMICECLAGKRPNAHGYVWKIPEHVDLLGEVWKLYAPTVMISNQGRYRRKLWGQTWTRAKAAYELTQNDGYPLFRANGRLHALHRAVAQLFLPTVSENLVVNHKDGNRLNASAVNLEWITQAENCKHAHDTGLNKTSKRVCQLGLDGEHIREHASLTSAAVAVNGDVRNVSAVCRGLRKTAYGFLWKYS